MTERAEERFYVEQFLRQMPDLRFVRQNTNPRDGADFVVADARGEIGLEVTRLFQDTREPGTQSQKKKREAARQKVVAKLAAKYYAIGGLPLFVHISFNERLVDVRTLAARMRDERPEQEWAQHKIEIEGPRGTLAVQLTLQSLPASMGTYSNWSIPGDHVGWVAQFGAADLQPRIDHKAAKLPTYREKNTRVALLLYAEPSYESGMLRWNPASEPPALRGFESVHFLHDHDRVVSWHAS